MQCRNVESSNVEGRAKPLTASCDALTFRALGVARLPHNHAKPQAASIAIRAFAGSLYLSTQVVVGIYRAVGGGVASAAMCAGSAAPRQRRMSRMHPEK